jgi:aminomethyltransferase
MSFAKIYYIREEVESASGQSNLPFIMNKEKLKKTSLYTLHKGLGARFTPFAGFYMPVQYTSVIDEHLAVRKAAGIFDVSHMGEIELSSDVPEEVLKALQGLTTNDVSLLKDGQCQYTLLCNSEGGVIDDVVLYRFSSIGYMLCVNGSNTEKVLKWILERVSEFSDKVCVKDLSEEYAQIAIQGSLAEKILGSIVDVDLSSIRYYHFIKTDVLGIEAIISRTGYTGEDGFEIYLSPAKAGALWEAITEAGAPLGLLPAGLAARDTLRLEMGFPLYGNELSEAINPLSAGLGKFVCLSKDKGKGDFIGAKALRAIKEDGVKDRLVALEMIDTGIPRSGYDILDDDSVVGVVTSGSYSPSLKRAIAMGYVPASLLEVGRELFVSIRGVKKRAKVSKKPFYKRPS